MPEAANSKLWQVKGESRAMLEGQEEYHARTENKEGQKLMTQHPQLGAFHTGCHKTFATITNLPTVRDPLRIIPNKTKSQKLPETTWLHLPEDQSPHVTPQSCQGPMVHGQSPTHPGDPRQDRAASHSRTFSPGVSETLLTPTLTSSMSGRYPAEAKTVPGPRTKELSTKR